MNWKFVLRGTLFALIALVALGYAGYRSLPRIFPGVPYGPTPRPPAITALRGNMPANWPGLISHATYAGSEPTPSGSGFIFRLPAGGTVAAAAAHSFNLAGELQIVQFSLDETSIELDTLHGLPGAPRTLSMNLTNDYVLFSVQEQHPPGEVLEPDDRGFPQPGERIVLYPGSGNEHGERWGTILESNQNGAWAVMDESFEAGMMSGSPIVSSHTGKVVGMALAAGLREGHTIIGMHPIGSLVEKGLEADDLVPIAEYEEE